MVHAPRIIPHHSNELKIHVENSELMMHGTAVEAAGCLLRGVLTLQLAEAIKVKSIVLKFVGTMKVAWADTTGPHQRYHKDERTVFQHEWVFLAPQKKTAIIGQGTYQWSFELPVPGDLPDSIQNAGLGEVSYKLKAIADRPSLVPNLTDKVRIQITRCLLPSATEFVQSLSISDGWASKLTYEVDIPSKMYGEGDKIPVSFKLTPIASDLKVRAVTCSLKEYTSVTVAPYTKTDGRIVSYMQDSDFPCEGPVWTQTEVIEVPRGFARIHCDTENDMMRIRHKLKFVIKLVNADGHISELRAAIPIMVSAISQDHEMNSLPAYEDAWRTLPYNPDAVAFLTGSYSPASSSNHSDSGEYNPTETDLMQVPSYNTAANMNDSSPYSWSLPSYDFAMVAA
ncbi:hypothetical protein BC936DRAFT_146364 [Jimgerdemannia flammicorona]|uniref:Arrestin C-terminal-like domain-containing protein n=1 Tax=Jimgerdemannia flammicorona TaxID=994334 RepID=A0A433D7T5_9FUNG|nr:hypothetical protein BC936DRAFT_146364 [Jimgerdemannia flammicorona]